MKKSLQRIVMLLAISWFSNFLLAQEFARVLDESFENGIPSSWIQEKVSGDIDWVVEGGDLQYPSHAFDGEKRVAFRNVSNTTTRAKTRLILPVLDLSRLYQPIIVFAHAQDKWAGDFDTLNILYRTSQEKDWVVLKTYDKYISKYQLDTLQLVGISKTYQLAFEAIDNLGKGIVLDKVEIRSSPNCLNPYDVQVDNITKNSAELSWLGSFDALSFSIKLSTKELTAKQLEDENFKADVLNIELSDVWDYKFENLNPDIEYYCYIKSNCGDESSDYTLITFKTLNILSIPYIEDFNVSYTANGVSRLDSWYGSSSSEDVATPYINSGLTIGKSKYSPDGTYVLCFSHYERQDLSSALLANEYSYCALPYLDIDDISRLEVSFWTIRQNPTLSTSFSIIVGVMDDQKDITTFVPVDTVDITSICTFEECIVSLENYKGQGKYIAFLSRFDRMNMFLMDNLKVDYRSAVSKVNFTLGAPTANSLKFDFDKAYDKYEVVISSGLVHNEGELDTLSTVLRREILDLDVIDGLKAASGYYVYARAIKDAEKGAWSTYKYVRLPGKAESYPYILSFEIDASDNSTFYSPSIGEYTQGVKGGIEISAFSYLVNEITFLTNNKNLPICDQSSKLDGAWSLKMDPREGGWLMSVLPELLIKETSVSFWAVNNSKDKSTSSFTIGLLSDALDYSTFKPIETITVGSKSQFFVFDLNNYNVEGDFFAIKVETQNSCFFTDLRYKNVLPCTSVTNVKAHTSAVNPKEVTITWDNNGVTSWNVRISETKYDVDSMLINGSEYSYVYNGNVTTPKVTISNLEYPKKRYFYTVQSVCADSVGDWIPMDYFDTECLDREPLPYTENFDKEDYSTYSGNTFPIPCISSQPMAISLGESTLKMPWIVGSQGYQYLSFRCNGFYPPSKYKQYVALPKMAQPVANLELSFMMWGTSPGQAISVGVMSDPMDTTTIEIVEVVRNKVFGMWIEQIVSFENYKGSGEYIVLVLDENCISYTSDINIDNIVVDINSECSRPDYVRVESLIGNEVKLAWRGTAGKYNVVISKQQLTSADLESALVNDVIICRETVNQSNFTYSELESNTPYYCYVRSICRDNIYGKWSTVLPFKTPCELATIEALGVESFETYGSGQGKYPSCYTVGNLTADASPLNIPQCFQAYAKTGKHSLSIASTIQDNGAYAITSCLDISDIRLLRMRFWASTGISAWATHWYAHSITVGVVTDPMDLSTFVPVGTFDISSDIKQYEVYFDKYKHDYNGKEGKYVMFLSEFDKQNRVYIDDVVFDRITDCYTDFDVTAVTDTSITLNFITQADSYQLKYSTHECEIEELNREDLEVIDINDANYEITGLDFNTKYYLYARSICNGVPGDWTIGEIARTSCPSKLKLPFFDDFEKNVFTQGGATPECWFGFYGQPGIQRNTSWPYITEYTKDNSGAKSGKKFVLMKEYTNASTYLVSSEIDVDSLSKCQVSLYVRPEEINSFRAIVIGAVSSLDSISETFVAIDTIVAFQKELMWEKFIVSLENYEGDAKHIAFRTDFVLNNNAIAEFYIDDVRIELMPDCQRPDYFRLLHHSDTSITISYGHDCAVKHEVIYGPVGFDVNKGGKIVETNSLQCKIGGLVAESSYDVYVRSYCDEEKCSPWTFAGTYSTISTPISTFPYYCDFEDEDEVSLWRFVQKNQPNQWCIGMDDKYVVADGVKSDDKAMYISFDGGHTANYISDPTGAVNTPNSMSWAYRTIQLDPGIYNFSYNWTCYGEKYYDYMIIGLLPTTSDFEAGSNIVVSSDGFTGYITTSVNSNVPKGWINLTQKVSKNSARANSIDTTLVLDAQWKNQVDRVIITPEMAGAYRLAFIWVNDATTRDNDHYSVRSAVVDDITITKEDCLQPIDLRLTAYDHNSVNLEWSTIVDNQKGFNVMLIKEEIDLSAEALDSTKIEVFEYFEETNCKITDLASSLEYYAYVQSVCGNGDVTNWDGPVVFETACSTQPVDTLYSFGSADTYTTIAMQNPDIKDMTGKFKIPNCFTVGHELFGYSYKGLGSTFRLVDIKDSGFVPTQFSRDKNNEDDNALYITYSNISAGGYIALPLVEGDITKMQLSFWMRPFPSNISDGGSAFSGTAGANYARQITVGTMTDPENLETFVALDTVLYPYNDEIIKGKYGNHVANDPNKNDFWVEYIIPLEKATGKYIAFKGEVYGTAIYNTMYIDDISVTSLACLTPTNIVLEDITSTSVKVNCSHGQNDRFVVEAAKNSQFTDGVIRDTVFSFPCVLKGLEPNTEYNLRISTLCDEEKTSSWSNIALFSSANTLSYDCDFSNVTGILPNDWKRATYSFQQVVIDKEISTFNYVSETNTTTWHVEKPLFDRGMFSTQHMAVFAKSYSHWLISPLVHLPVDQKQHLVFDLSLSDYGYNAPITEMDRLDVDNRFILLISEDAGKTWTRDNSIIWGKDAYCAYNDIPFEGEQYVVDLTKYSGKVIQVAFYVESGSAIGEETVLHLDNVHINSYITSVEESVVCQSEDYEDDIFVIASEQIEVGDNSFEQIKFVKEIGNPDILNKLHLKVKPMLITDVVGRVCEGDVYSGYNFNGLIESGIYKQKHIAKNGCDSVVILNLQVDPILSEMFIDTICYGNSVVWNGVEYDRSGVYTDTLISKLTGCDSIVTFVLQVNDAIRSELFVNICYGDTYEFGSQIVSKSGDYDELYETAEGCDSIVTLHANVLPDYRQTINAVIQEGDVYSENGFVGLAFDGVYTLPLKSADGCDSTLTLNLVVINSDTTYVETEITTNDLPFEYYDVYYDENTEPGVYIDTIYMDLDSCENCVIIHTLTILVADAVNDVRIYNVSLVPNPIKANEVLYVNADFTELESKGLIVSVFNTLGECVYIDKPMMYPIKIEDLDQTGFYIVRILTGDGKTYQGKIIVE